MKAAVPLAG